MLQQKKQRGSITLEYALVTAFVAMASIVMLGVVTHMVKEKLSDLTEKIGADIDEIDFGG